MHHSRRWLLIVFALTGVVPAFGETLLVPGDHATIQACIDAAVDGADECVVAAGVYNEAIDFGGKAVTVRSAEGSAVTTIDGTGLGDSTVRCVSGEGPGSILDGFTVTGGTGGACPFNASLACGGGMLVSGSGPTVRNCVFFQNQADFGGGVVNTGGSTTMLDDCLFDGNTASELGGGMYNDSSSAPVVSGSTFSGNAVASNYDTGAGGGMYNHQSDAVVTDCVFEGNSADAVGGGMSNMSGSDATVTGCTFRDNTASDDGGGMYNHQSAPIVVNCTFDGNETVNAMGGGGGMYNFDNTSAVVVNCVFVENASWFGAAMANRETQGLSVTNCTFASNTADDAGGAMRSENGADLTVVNCIFRNDSPDEIVSVGMSPSIRYCNVQGGSGGDGNIDADPMFVDAAGGDLRLTSGSPSIDAGENTVSAGATADLDGGPRFADDPDTINTGAGFGPIVDMGAYEFHQPLSGDLDLDGDVDLIDYSIFQSLFTGAGL